MKPGKLQGNKQRSQDLSWKVRDRAQSLVLAGSQRAPRLHGSGLQ